MLDLATALALVLVVEGLAYAIFPGFMRRMMETALTMPAATLRATGLGAAVLGVGLVWLIRG